MDTGPQKTMEEKIKLLDQQLVMKTPMQVEEQRLHHPVQAQQQQMATNAYQRLFQNFLPVPADSPPGSRRACPGGQPAQEETTPPSAGHQGLPQGL